jgi:hypothetical protein
MTTLARPHWKGFEAGMLHRGRLPSSRRLPIDAFIAIGRFTDCSRNETSSKLSSWTIACENWISQHLFRSVRVDFQNIPSVQLRLVCLQWSAMLF